MSITPNTTFASREVSDLVFVDYSTKKPFLSCDYANTSAVEITGESVFAYGGQGHPRRVTFYGEKSGTMTIETQISTMKLYQLQTGGTMSNTADFLYREKIVCKEAGKLVLKRVPNGPVSVYPAEYDCDDTYAITGAVADKTFTATGEGVEVGKEYVIYYAVEYLSRVQRISINAKDAPKAYTIYASTVNRTEDDQIIPYNMIVYKGSPQINFAISQANSGDPITLTITLDIMADAEGRLIDLFMIDDEDGDYVPVDSISLSNDVIGLANGGSEQLTVTFEPAEATERGIRWTSNNEELVVVSADGLVTAAADGTGSAVVVATAEDGGAQAFCVVNVG